MEQGRVYIYSYGYKCDETIEHCLASVQHQSIKYYKHFICHENTSAYVASIIDRYCVDDSIYTVITTDDNTQLGWLYYLYNHVVPQINDNDIIIFLDLYDYLGTDSELLYNYIMGFARVNYELGYSNCAYQQRASFDVDIPYLPEVTKKKNYETSTFKFYGLRAIKGHLLSLLHADYFMSDEEFIAEGYEVAFFSTFLKLVKHENIYYNPEVLVYRNDDHPEYIEPQLKKLPIERKRVQMKYQKLNPTEYVNTISKFGSNILDIVTLTTKFNANKRSVKTYLMGISNIFHEPTLDDVLSTEKPLVTIAMLSWLRTDKLLLTLEHLFNTIRVPINVCLYIQGYEKLSRVDEVEIHKLLDNFNAYTIVKKEHNIGTGIPRHSIVHTALDTYNTPYLLTLDDDMLYPIGGLEAQLTILESHPELGAVSLNCVPEPNALRIKENEQGDMQVNRIILSSNKNLTPVDICGSASKITRREVYETCDLDPEYTIGFADYDFSLQLYQNNWKIAVICPNALKAVNNAKHDSKEYKDIRANKEIIKKSKNRLLSKWNITGL